MNTPGTPEFSAWKSELQAKGKNVMIINANSENTINSLNY
jgi:predicted HAD superfamily phosphohydrolase YqeG